VGYAHSDENAFSLRTASEGPYNSQEEGRKMARVNPPLHGRRSHARTTQGGRGGGEQAAGYMERIFIQQTKSGSSIE